MRSSKSRSRSKANRPRTLGNIVNRVFDSSGPEGKVRGTPAQIIEKYQFLARDAQLSNDRVAAENFLQHAEHYTRMLAEAMREQQAEQEARQQFHQQNQQGNQGQGGNRDRDGGGGNGNGGGNGGNGQNGGYAERREQRFDRREDRFDRDEQPAPYAAGAGLGPVIDAEDEDEAGPVETPEAARVEPTPRAERPRFETRRNDDRRGEDQRPAVSGEGEGQRSPRGPRPQQNRPPRAEAEQPGLPAFITGAAEDPVDTAPEPAAEKPASEKTPRAPRAPRKPAAAKAKPAEPVGAEGDAPKGE